MVNVCAVCGGCTRIDIVREHLEDTIRICDVSGMGLYTIIIIYFYLVIFRYCFSDQSPDKRRMRVHNL
jgi:hypothetical protein